MLDPDATPQDPGCFPFHAKFRTRASREDTEVILKTAEELTEGSLVEADNGNILEVVKIEPITPMHSYELRTESTTDAPGAVLKCTGRHRIMVPVESDGEFGVEQAVRLSRGQRVYCSGFVERTLVDVTMQNEHIKFYGITFDPDEAVAVTTTEDDHVAILSMGEEHGGTNHKIQRGHKRGSGTRGAPSIADTAEFWPDSPPPDFQGGVQQ